MLSVNIKKTHTIRLLLGLNWALPNRTTRYEYMFINYTTIICKGKKSETVLVQICFIFALEFVENKFIKRYNVWTRLPSKV